MNWETFYLLCFVVGFLFCALSFVSGFLHLPFHGLKGLHFGGGHHVGHVTHVGGGATHGAHHHLHHGASSFSIFNPMTIATFLTWFGGAGYLLVHYRHIWLFTGLLLAGGAGAIGAAIVFVFVAKVLMANDYETDPQEYEMVGVLGRISSTVRQGGTGEIIFEQQGVRRTCAARCEAAEALSKGEEVVVTRYERGVAYVRRWDDLARQHGVLSEHETGN